MKEIYKSFFSFLKTNGFRGEVRLNENLKKHTTWRVGGEGDIVVLPENKEDLVLAMVLSCEFDLPVTVLGNGSNILIRDGGIRGLVIITSRINHYTIEPPFITAGGGAKLNTLLRAAAEKNLSGLEFAAGIPASLGGAVLMNAGAHGQCMGPLIEKICSIGSSGEENIYNKKDMDFTYRKSFFENNQEIIFEAVLCFNLGNKEEIMCKIKEYEEARKNRQPLDFASAGCVFKNTSEYPAGYLIENSGLKGLKVGSAQVSVKHANFIINLGDAKSGDIIDLIKIITDKVYKKFGVLLEREVKILGED